MKVENGFDHFIEKGTEINFDVSPLIFEASFLKVISISFNFVSIPPNILRMDLLTLR